MTKHQEDYTLAEKRRKVYYHLSQKEFQKAYDLASQYDLHEPWKGFCAYHLAHLTMLADSNGPSGVAAEKLFQEAGAAKFLGPFPFIYRLAALERVEIKDRQKLKDSFTEALRSFSELAFSDRLEGDESGQKHYRNMLRLAAYYFGYPTESAVVTVPRNGNSFWVLVGNDPKLAKLKLSKAFVFEEMEALCRKYSESVFFKLSKKDPHGEDELERHWKLGESPWQKMPHYPALLLLYHLLRGQFGTIAGLKSRLHATDDAFAQIKKRLKIELSDLLQIPKTDIFISGRGQFPRLNPDILIFGAFEA